MMRSTLVKATLAALLGLLSFQAPLHADAAHPAPPVSPSVAPAAIPLTKQDAEAWLDGYMSYALPSSGIPGGVVVLVKDGRVLLEKGYGVSNVATGAPVDPARTLFRGGSVSKLFTWTAVMQLVEQRKLDLDADVNTYLDFRIPPFAGQPVTLRNIMTHTAGFEEAHRAIATLDPNHIPTLGDSLRQWIPARVYPAGTTPAYSNYAAALAGYIVQRVSREPFDDYVERHIFAPLGMRHATFREPLPPALRNAMSQGYPGGTIRPEPFELVVWKPAGSLSVTGDDMARFIIAHLQDGAFGNGRILGAATAREMHATATVLMPPLNGMELGFWQQNINGRRVIAHAGDTVYFHSLLTLYPDDNIGIFMSFNSAGARNAVNAVRQKLFQQFSDRYLPDRSAPDGRVDDATAKRHAAMFAGAYASSRSSFSAFMAAIKLLDPIRAFGNADGTVSVSVFKNASGGLKRYREISPFLWREVGGHDRLAGIVKEGRIVRLSNDDYAPITVLDAVPAWKSPVVLLPAFEFGLMMLVLTVAYWPVRALVRRRFGMASSSLGARARSARMLRITAALALVPVVGWLWLLSVVMSPTGIYFLSDHDLWIYAIELLTIVAFPGALLGALFHFYATWSEPSGWGARLWAAAMVGGTIALVYVAALYRLMTLSAQF